MNCPECWVGELEEYEDYIECPECGAQFELGAEDEEDLEPIEDSDEEFYD